MGQTVEPCAIGELRLTRDGKGRLVKAEFYSEGKRHGPTLTLDPGGRSGKYYKKDDSHEFSYGSGRAYMYTAWDDEAQDGCPEPYDAWVERCLEDLRSRGLGILWKKGEDALTAGKKEIAADCLEKVLKGWGLKPTVWMDPGDERNARNRAALALLIAAARGEAKMDGAWDDWSGGEDDPDESSKMLKVMAKAIGVDGVARLRSRWIKADLDRIVAGAEKDNAKLQSALERRFESLAKHTGWQGAFGDELIAAAEENPRLGPWATFFGVKAAGKPTGKTRAILEKRTGAGEADVADLNNLALHQINAHELAKARATLDRVAEILKGRPELPLPIRAKKPSVTVLKQIDDEYFYSVHRASLLWMEKRHVEAWPFAERALALETAQRELNSFKDPFGGGTRFGAARSGGSWACLSVLTGLGRFADADKAFRGMLADEPVMAARLKLDAPGAEHMLIGGLCNYLDPQDAKVLALSKEPYACVKKLVPEPDVANLTYTYACLEARFGNPKPALALLKRAFEQGASKAHAKNDPDFKALKNDPAFKRLVASG